MRAEAHLVVVDGKVGDAAAELEKTFPRVAVALVLLNRVLDGLLREAVLELEGCDRQAVDEEAEVEGPLGLVPAVAQLARHAEAVGREALGRRGVAGRGRSVEEVDVVRPMLDTVAQDVDRAALADLALEPREELPPGGTVVAQVERLGRLRLRRAQESREVRKVHAVLPVVVGGIAADVPGSSIRS